jgi:hypothetical protein
MSIQQRNLEALQHFPLAPTEVRSTTFTGATINVANLVALDGDIQVILDSSAVTGAGSITCVIQHSVDGTTNFEAVTGGAFAAVTSAAASKQILTLSKDDIRQHIRVVGTVSGAASAAYSVNGYGLAKYQ